MAGDISIAGRLNAVTTANQLAGTDQIYDDTESKFQNVINQEKDEAINSAVEDLNDSIELLRNELSGDIDELETTVNETITNRITEIQTQIDNLDISTYKGLATPTTTPETGVLGMFYTANRAGTYTNFSGVTVKEGSAILYYNGSSWEVHQIMEAMDTSDITDLWGD